jgi:hypothetical protein
MSGHKFAERGEDVLQICVFMTDIHNIIRGLKIAPLYFNYGTYVVEKAVSYSTILMRQWQPLALYLEEL